ncbi:molybdopterin molybdotransferase MoeA, partial [Candidatus Bathyarchaeota archaeon]|nr:molybdopterin molybdotransferase MoeA [Candidatus Bathyarchaeota archaeon]
EAINRVLSSDIIVKEDLPRFDKSAVDGYALLANDTIGASQFKSVSFSLTTAKKISSKQAIQVWTGNPIPDGADSVVMIENTKKHNSQLEIYTQLPKWANVSKKGEDVQSGEIGLKSGTRLKPHHLALLAALGYMSIKVTRKPRIAVLATGNELVDSGGSISVGKIFESNRIAISGLCKELDSEPIDLGIAKDDVNDLSEKISLGLNNCDALITTGGTSVGQFDLLPEVVNKIGNPGIIVHGMALRPAMPTGLAVVGGKPILLLSGNPVAAMIGFEEFMRPLISRMLGLNSDKRQTIHGIMNRKVATRLGRKTYLRVRIFQKNTEFIVEPISARGSGIISSMTKANGFVVVPANREGIRKGELVSVQLFGIVEEN